MRPLVQGRYGARLVEKDAYLLRLSRYVHLNPVFTAVARRQPVRERIAMLREYRWSSYRSYIGRDRPLSFVDYGPILASVTAALSGSAQEYRRFVESGIETIDTSLLEVRRASALCIGSEAFRGRIGTLYHRLLDSTSRREDMAFRRPGTVLSAEAILAVVCRHLDVERGALLRRHRNSFDRPIAARMLCDYGGLTQRQVAETLGIGTGSPISQQSRKLTGELESNRAMQKQVSAIAAELRGYTRNAND